jgi:hypothetical protein
MRTIIIASLGLNAILLGAVAFLSVRGPTSPTPETTAASEPALAMPVPSRSRALSVVRIEGGDDFHWSQIESTDFKQYMANLRTIGCPEETIRDLIIAEVNKMFAPRFAALAAETQKFEYWSQRSKPRDTILTQLHGLQQERRTLLRELLGIDDDSSAKWASVDLDKLRQEGKFSFLSAEKQAQVRAIMEKYQQQLEAGRAGQGGLVKGDSDQSKRLREQRQQELAQVLTPDEFKELSLRDSNTADSVRNRFGSADLTEAEYRKMFDLRKAYEDTQGAVADYSDPEKMRQRSEARRQLEEAYKTAIGEDRWNEIQRQQDPTWRGLTEFAQQNNISPSVIDQAWQQQQQTGEQIMRALEDRSLGRDQREALVQQFTAEYDRSLKNLLGEQAFQQFKQTNPGFTFSSGAGDAFSFVTSSPGGGARSLTVSDGVKTKLIQRPAPGR